MGRGKWHTLRKVAAAFALLSVALYALLLPWHLTSQFNAQLFKAEFGQLSAALCTSGETSSPTTPGAPGTSCPICKGLAAFHFAVAPAAQPELAPPPVLAIVYKRSRSDLTSTESVTPRNRGPPTLPA
jgi:hypothetical protein